MGGDTGTYVPNDIGGCGSGDTTGTSPSPASSSYSSSYVIMHNCNMVFEFLNNSDHSGWFQPRGGMTRLTFTQGSH